jgi:hypothetical protein
VPQQPLTHVRGSFNGEEDRMMGAAAFILVLPLTPFAFWIWEARRSRR